MTTAQQELSMITKEIIQLRNKKSHLDLINSKQQECIAERDRLANLLQKEYNDVVSLEKMSVKGLFLNILGNKNQQLEKERQEYAEIAMLLKEKNNEVHANEFEISVLSPKVVNLAQLEVKYKTLLKTREQEILYNTAEKDHLNLKSLIIKEQEEQYFIVQLKEAIEETKLGVNSCNAVLTYLGRAKNWGSSGFGQAQSYYGTKTSIDNALNEMYNFNRILQKLRKELMDIGLNKSELTLDVDKIVQMFKMYIGNMISDWIFQKRIESTFILIKDIGMSIKAIGESLNIVIDKSEGKIVEIRSQISDLVSQSSIQS